MLNYVLFTVFSAVVSSVSRSVTWFISIRILLFDFYSNQCVPPRYNNLFVNQFYLHGLQQSAIHFRSVKVDLQSSVARLVIIANFSLKSSEKIVMLYILLRA